MTRELKAVLRTDGPDVGDLADGSAQGAAPSTAPRRSRPKRLRPLSKAAAIFTRFAWDYASQNRGQQVLLLEAGCTTTGDELDLDALHASGVDLVVSRIDDDNPVTRATVADRDELRGATLGDLRSVPLKPRSFDIVHCSGLLERIGHAELVLGRLAEALRPGGLLLLRCADRDSNGGPSSRSASAWPKRGGRPRGRLAVDPIVGARRIESFAARHGLALAHRQAVDGYAAKADPDVRSGISPVTHGAVGALSRGNPAEEHDELRYVFRRPVVARVL